MWNYFEEQYVFDHSHNMLLNFILKKEHPSVWELEWSRMCNLVSIHQPLNCLFKSLSRLTIKTLSKFHTAGPLTISHWDDNGTEFELTNLPGLWLCLNCEYLGVKFLCYKGTTSYFTTYCYFDGFCHYSQLVSTLRRPTICSHSISKRSGWNVQGDGAGAGRIHHTYQVTLLDLKGY